MNQEKQHKEKEGQEARPLLITGGNGTLAQAFSRLCELRGLPYRLLSRQELDVADSRAVERALEEIKPWAVVNAAGYVAVDAAEQEPYLCFRQNTKGAATLAAACSRHDIQLLTFSSDLVFDGAKRTPYVESDPVSPLSVYGRSKAEAELRVQAFLPSALIVRSGALFGPWDEKNFVTRSLQALASGRTVFESSDALITPAYVPDLVDASLDLLIDGESGIWHLANDGGPVTRTELVRQAATRAGLDTAGMEGWSMEAMHSGAPRPAYSVLGSERGMLLPPLENALARYILRSKEMWTVKEQPIRSAVTDEGFRRLVATIALGQGRHSDLIKTGTNE